MQFHSSSESVILLGLIQKINKLFVHDLLSFNFFLGKMLGDAHIMLHLAFLLNMHSVGALNIEALMKNLVLIDGSEIQNWFFDYALALLLRSFVSKNPTFFSFGIFIFFEICVESQQPLSLHFIMIFMIYYYLILYKLNTNTIN